MTRYRGAARRALTALALVIGIGLLTAPVAAAHATLESSNPADGAVLDTAPSEVTLSFSETVRITLSSVRVLDGQGKRVDRGNTTHGAHDAEVRVGLNPNLARGTYVVAWSVISDDGHPIHGGFTFSVGSKSAVGDDVLSSALTDRGSGAWGAVGDVARFAHLLGALLAIGGACFLALVDGRHSSVLGRWVMAGAIAGLAGSIVELPVLAAQAAGLGLSSITQPGVASQVLGDGEGLSVALLAAALLAAWISTRIDERTPRLAVLTFAFVGFTLSFLLTGHARTSEPRWLVLTADGVHVAAAAIWVGGVVLLIGALRRRHADSSGATGAAGVVARFSAVATVAIVAVIVAGGALSWVEVRSLSALDSTYGWLLIAKIGLVSLVAAAGAFNHFRLVPAIGRAESTDGTPQAWAMLHRTLRLEAIGMVAVLGVTSVLAATPPARVSAGVASGPVAVTAPLGDGTLNVVVDPARAGTSQLHAYVLDSSGRPMDTVRSVTVSLRLPEKGLGPFQPRAVKAGPGHYQVLDATFPYPGTWEVTVDVRVDEFTALTATVSVAIR